MCVCVCVCARTHACACVCACACVRLCDMSMSCVLLPFMVVPPFTCALPFTVKALNSSLERLSFCPAAVDSTSQESPPRIHTLLPSQPLGRPLPKPTSSRTPSPQTSTSTTSTTSTTCTTSSSHSRVGPRGFQEVSERSLKLSLQLNRRNCTRQQNGCVQKYTHMSTHTHIHTHPHKHTCVRTHTYA